MAYIHGVLNPKEIEMKGIVTAIIATSAIAFAIFVMAYTGHEFARVKT